MGDDSEGGMTPLEARRAILGDQPAIPKLHGSGLSAPLIDWSMVSSWGVWARPGLDLKDRAFITCMTLAVLNRLDKLETHLIGAFRQGWRPRELAEAFLQLTVYAGVAAGTDAFDALTRAIAQAGPDIVPLDDDAGDGAPLVPHEVRTRVVSAHAPQPDLGPASLYAPLSQWAGAAVWDTWSRPGIELRYRSMVVCVCTAVLNRMDLLVIHLHGGMRLGWTREQLGEALLQMTVYTGVAVGTDAFAALARAAAAMDAEQAEGTT